MDGDFRRWIATGKVETRWTKSGAQVMRGNGQDASAARKYEQQRPQELFKYISAVFRAFEDRCCMFMVSDGSRLGDPPEESQFYIACKENNVSVRLAPKAGIHSSLFRSAESTELHEVPEKS